MEQGLVTRHTHLGVTEYTLPDLGVHALLEIPVLAVTVCIMLAQQKGPFSSQLPHIASIAQTVTGLTLHTTWLLYSRPKEPSRSFFSAIIRALLLLPTLRSRRALPLPLWTLVLQNDWSCCALGQM